MRDPMPNPAKTKPDPAIALNKRARYDYFIEESMEAGLALQGWEVKSLRSGRGRITEAYVIVKDGEAWLLGSHFAPLSTTSTHVVADPTRTRKLLMHRAELDRLVGAVERKGQALIPLAPLLEERQGEARGRSCEGQEGTRQARNREGSRLAAGEVAPDETAPLRPRPRRSGRMAASIRGRPVSTWVAKLHVHAEVQGSS